MEIIKQFELSKEYLESLRLAIESEDLVFIEESLEGVNVADIAAILDELSMEESIYVLRALTKQTAADILIELDDNTLFRVLKEINEAEIADISYNNRVIKKQVDKDYNEFNRTK